jgi:hypothetical protein
MVRRSIAFGAGVIVLILFVLLVKSCQDSRKEAAINDYVRDVDGLVGESNRQGEALFQQLDGEGDASDVDVENALNSFRIQSAQLVDRARDLDPPEELDPAQQYLIETFDFRSDGIQEIADQLPSALAGGDQQEGAADRIAGAMRPFLASDQIYLRRVMPVIDTVLKEEGLQQQLAESAFLTDLGWLDPAEVASRIGGIGGASGDEDAAPGTHGNGLGAVTLGGQTLVPGGSASITLGGDLAFDVQIANQGENTETDVRVTVTVGSGSDAIELEGVLDTIAAGETKSVTIPLEEEPPTGQSVPIAVEIETVPGEDPAVGNNSGEFTAIFTS